MRKPIAVFALLAFANLLISQAGGFCPLAGANHQESAQAMAALHESHHAAPPKSHSHDANALADTPDPGADHSCLAVGACVLSVDMDRSIAATAVPLDHHGVLAASDAAPRSQIPPPDSPPPRA